MIRGLLACGVIGPLLFIVVFTLEGWLRHGYSPRRHFVSSLANGRRGWVQIANFLQCGIFVLCFAAAACSSAAPAMLGGVVPWLLGAFGAGLIVSGVFTTDAAVGGSEASYAASAAAPATASGRVHGLAGLVVFASLAVAACVVAVRFARAGSACWAVGSAAAGLAVAGFFIRGGVLIAREARAQISDAPLGLCQRLAIIPGWTWLALFAAHLLQGG